MAVNRSICGDLLGGERPRVATRICPGLGPFERSGLDVGVPVQLDGVPRGVSQPDRAGITVGAFGRSPARQW